jgi:hypothetical protein
MPEMNTKTGECDTEAAIDEMYRANGRPCQLGGCTHTSVSAYELYGKERREGRVFIFLCACCLLLKRLERAKWHASQVERLEAEYEQEKATCPK